MKEIALIFIVLAVLLVTAFSLGARYERHISAGNCAAILKAHDAAIVKAIQRLNSDTYNLTKAECVEVLRSLKGQP